LLFRGDEDVDHPGVSSVAQTENAPFADRDRLEILRFSSVEAQLQAIRFFLACGMLNFTSSKEEEWLVRTAIARKLRDLGVPFEWLTEHI
jgi:hypothetical protein